MIKTDLEQDKNTTSRTTLLSGAFVKAFLGGAVVAVGFMRAGEISDYFTVKGNLTVNIIIYALAVFLSIFLVAQLVSRLLKPLGFKGFNKQPNENMTVIKFFAGAALGIFAVFLFVALIFLWVLSNCCA